jgi:hypothetical protein
MLLFRRYPMILGSEIRPSICLVMPSKALVGSNAFTLAYNAKSVTDTRSELGLRTDKSFAMTDGLLTLAVAWPGRLITIRTARSPQPSSRCRARTSSSMARRRLPTPRSSQRRSKEMADRLVGGGHLRG